MINMKSALDIAQKIVDKVVEWSPAIRKGEATIKPFADKIAGLVPGGTVAVTVVEGLLDGVLSVAPEIQQGLVSGQPYILALAGLLTGTNATRESLDALMVQLKADSDEFMLPLPPDDGSTTT